MLPTANAQARCRVLPWTGRRPLASAATVEGRGRQAAKSRRYSRFSIATMGSERVSPRRQA